MRSLVQGAGSRGRYALSAATALVLAPGLLFAQKSAQGPVTTPPTTSDVSVNVLPQNMLRFPYGVQTFERLKPGHQVTDIPGWEILGAPNVNAFIAEDPGGQPRPGTHSKRFICVEDYGAQLGQGFRTPVITAPAPWDYAWSFQMRIVAPPAPGSEPVLAVQHPVGSGGYQDAWGVRMTNSGAELYLTGSWGVPDVAPLFDLTGATGVGQWVHLRVVASLETNRLEAYVNGTQVASLGMRPRATTDVRRQRLSYHGTGTGNFATLMLDDVGVAFLSGVCKESLDVTFDMDDDGSLLANGQDISSAEEFGEMFTVDGSGPNNGAAIFDSSIGGPNDPSQDNDLLLDTGNVLILQSNNAAISNQQTVAGIFDRPNDDADGGTFTWTFNRPTQPLAIDVMDIDASVTEGVVLTLTDGGGNTRVYTVPMDWTGDVTLAQPGIGTLDLTTLADQPGFNSTATAVEDAGFDGSAVVSMVIEMGGSGALDNFHACIPCVELTFDSEDDGVTPLVNGQDISSPPEFGIEVSISAAGANAGAAIFDSTPGGPNDPGPDNDLLVGLGNILCLQNDLFATQTVAGIFDTPNDDTNGGDLFFDFPGPVTCHFIDLIDVDEEEVTGVTLTLLDTNGKTRVYTVPPSWTEDLLNDGPPGFRTLDLESLLPQPGFAAVATAVEDAGFDPELVIQLHINLGGAQDVDNLCFCP